MSIKIDDLAKELEKALDTYGAKIQTGVDEETVKVADKTSKTLKQTSPKDTGEYRKNWKVNLDKRRIVLGVKATVYNKLYRLPHLLENGHVKRGGGRVQGRPHIKPAEEQAVKEFEEGVIGVIKRGVDL